MVRVCGVHPPCIYAQSAKFLVELTPEYLACCSIVGVVEGNVIASGNVMLTGVVKGNIECNNIIVDGTDYSQCIRAKGSVSIKQNTTISGPIYCKHISISGTIIGNIRAMGNVGLTKDAIVKGDITSSILAVEPGAKIAGNLLIK